MLDFNDFSIIEQGYADGSIEGWIPPIKRTFEQHEAHGQAQSEMPTLYLGGVGLQDEQVDLTKIWSHQSVINALGFAFPGVHQYTGSCVGAGGGNMLMTLIIIEILMKGDLEEIKVPFWLLPYGRSRFYAGMKSPGEGSLGSTFAKSAKEDGVIEATLSNLPRFENKDGLSWYENAERSWSDGDAKQTMDLLSESRKHPCQTVAQIRNTDELEAGIRNLYPATNASSLIPNMRVESDGEAYGRVARSGGHQTTFLGVWRHPVKGKRFFKYVNQWGLNWGKNGMGWIPDEDTQAIINDGEETYLFSSLQGFPAQTLPEDLFNLIK